MFLENLLKKIKAGDKNSELQFFYANYRLIYEFQKSFGVLEQEEDDFVQLCFLGYQKALEAYTFDSEYSFLAYYRRCVKHEYYMYSLEMHFPLRIPQKRLEEAKIKYSRTVPYNDAEGDLSALDDALLAAEEKQTVVTFWSCIYEELPRLEYVIIYNNYKKALSLQKIAKALHIEFSEAKVLRQRALQRLSRCCRIQEIAKDLYGINF